MMYAVSRTYISNENEIIYLILHPVITVKQTVINGICDSYKWYHTNINIKHNKLQHVFKYMELEPRQF